MAQNSSLANKEIAQVAPKADFLAKQAANALSPLTLYSVPAQNKAENQANDRNDYFVEKDGVVFAGSHILVDLWGASMWLPRWSTPPSAERRQFLASMSTNFKTVYVLKTIAVYASVFACIPHRNKQINAARSNRISVTP